MGRLKWLLYSQYRKTRYRPLRPLVILSGLAHRLRTQADIAALGREALPFKADVSQADQVQAMVDAAVARFGRLDVLVNGASIWRSTLWPDVSEADWDLLHSVAVKGSFLCARTAAPHLKAHGDGAIINFVDLSVLTPFPGYLAMPETA